MKKLFLAVVILMVSAAVHAQGTSFSIGLETHLPVGKFNDFGYKFGIGGSVQVDHKIAKDAAITLNAGYINHANTTTTPHYHFSVIPVMGGVKYWFTPKVYGSAQLGAAFNSSKVSNSSSSAVTSTGFAYAPGIGINITKGLDVLVKYFGNSVSGTTFSSVGARLAYNFGN